MSSYKGNQETCPVCGLTYKAFKTGLTYAEVASHLWSTSEDCHNWIYKRRNTVLGRWFMLKQEYWARHKEECSIQREYERAGVELPTGRWIEPIYVPQYSVCIGPGDGDVPF